MAVQIDQIQSSMVSPMRPKRVMMKLEYSEPQKNDNKQMQKPYNEWRERAPSPDIDAIDNFYHKLNPDIITSELEPSFPPEFENFDKIVASSNLQQFYDVKYVNTDLQIIILNDTCNYELLLQIFQKLKFWISNNIQFLSICSSKLNDGKLFSMKEIFLLFITICGCFRKLYRIFCGMQSVNHRSGSFQALIFALIFSSNNQ